MCLPNPLHEVIAAHVLQYSVPEYKTASRNIDIDFGLLKIFADGLVGFRRSKTNQVGLLDIPLLSCHLKRGKNSDLAAVGHTVFAHEPFIPRNPDGSLERIPAHGLLRTANTNCPFIGGAFTIDGVQA